MEEILASIRRIITDEEDGDAPATADAGDAQPDAAPESEEEGLSQDDLDKLFDSPGGDDTAEEENVLDLTEDDMVPDEDIDFAEPFVPEEPEISFAGPLATPEIEPVDTGAEAIMSSGPDTMVSNAFGDLSNTIVNHSNKTMEDLVKEMLRPLLRNWLDDNLPPLVERLVRQEIERVSKQGR